MRRYDRVYLVGAVMRGMSPGTVSIAATPFAAQNPRPAITAAGMAIAAHPRSRPGHRSFAPEPSPRIERDDHNAGEQPGPARASSTSSSIVVGEKHGVPAAQQARQPMLGAGKLLDRNDSPDAVHRCAPSASAASSTTRASASRSSSRRHQRSGHRHPRVDRDDLGVGVVDDVTIQQIAVARRHRRRRWVQPKLAHHLRGRALHRPPADDRRHRDDRRAHSPPIASRTPGIARIGSTLMNGLDGQITTACSAGSASAARKSGCGRAASRRRTPARAPPARSAGGRNNPGNRASRRPSRSRVRTRIVAHRQHARADAQPAAQSAVTADSVSPRAAAGCAPHASRDRGRRGGTSPRRPAPPASP